jgi:hypothetical protein
VTVPPLVENVSLTGPAAAWLSGVVELEGVEGDGALPPSFAWPDPEPDPAPDGGGGGGGSSTAGAADTGGEAGAGAGLSTADGGGGIGPSPPGEDRVVPGVDGAALLVLVAG